MGCLEQELPLASRFEKSGGWSGPPALSCGDATNLLSLLASLGAAPWERGKFKEQRLVPHDQVVPTASSHYPAISLHTVKLPTPAPNWHLETNTAKDTKGATHPLQGGSDEVVLSALPPLPSLPWGAARPPLSTSTASTLQDYLLVVFAPVSLCSGTRIPSIFPLPGPAAHSRSQRGILAAGVRRPARGAPVLPLLHASPAPAHPNARAGLAQGGGLQGIPGEGGEGGFWGVSRPSIVSILTWRGCRRGIPGHRFHEQLLQKPTQHLHLCGVSRNWAQRCLSGSATKGVAPPAPASHPTTCLLPPGAGRTLSRQPKAGRGPHATLPAGPWGMLLF